jgi:hypothetical protein
MTSIDEILRQVNERAQRDQSFRERLENAPIETLQDEGIDFTEEELRTFLSGGPVVHTMARISPKCISYGSRTSTACGPRWLEEEVARLLSRRPGGSVT